MDRLTTLMTQFTLSVTPAQGAKGQGDCTARAGGETGAAGRAGCGNLFVVGDDAGAPRELIYFTRETAGVAAPEPALWVGAVDWAGEVNPFLLALPERVTYDLTTDVEALSVVEIIRSESDRARCGAQSVVNRLAEVLIVRLLRDQLRRGTAEPGLLAGLADARISRAVVAIHDRPGQGWSNATLAQEAGLSLSRFSELFSATVGETPMGYLRRWRLILAQRDLRSGARVDAVARRYAYASAEAFSRAFRRAYGMSPMDVRRAERVPETTAQSEVV